MAYSPKSLSTNWLRRTANLPSTFLFTGMVSVVSQMLRQDLNTLTGHLAATFYLRGLLNTSISRPTPNKTSYPEPWRTFKSPPPGIVLPTPSSTVSSKYHIHQILLIRPLALPNHQLHNLLTFDTRPRNEGVVQPTPRVVTKA